MKKFVKILFKVNATMKVLAIATLAVTMSGAAMASHVCAYANDNVYGPNFVEGYRIGPGTSTIHLGPYSTNGSGTGGGFYAGGFGAARAREGDLYVSDGLSSNITHFTINKRDCTLTKDPTLYPSGDTGAVSGDILAITPDGSTIFVNSTGDNHIYSHTIAANGSLGATFTEASTYGNPNGFEVSPDGKTLVAGWTYYNQVCAYPIAGGHLSTPNCQSTGNYVTGVSIDPNSACVYAAEENENNISEVSALPLTGSILGAAIDYNPFGPGLGSVSGILVNWDNKSIYVSDTLSAQVASGSIAPDCKLTYKAIFNDGLFGVDLTGEIAQSEMAHDYVVTGEDKGTNAPPGMGIFRAGPNGQLIPIGSGQFRLMSGASPTTVLVIGAGSP